MQGEDALRTVECLRGRLLAERAASRAATETADLMTTKLKELEQKLRIEEKCRRKAEKKLKILKKKLESLNIGFRISEESDYQCSASVADHVSETSSVSISSTNSSSSSTTGCRSDPGDGDLKPRSIDCCSSSSCSSKSENNNADRGEGTIEAQRKVEKDLETDNYCGMKPSTMEENKEKEEHNQRGDINHVDNSMALVVSSPVEPEKPSNRETKVNSERVREVLDVLKQIRENIESTMERRRMIQVG